MQIKKYTEKVFIKQKVQYEKCDRAKTEYRSTKKGRSGILLVHHTREIWNMYGRELRGKDK